MKKSNLLLVLLAVVTMFSCKNDDDGGSGVDITEANLTGTWQLTVVLEDGEVVALDDCELMSTVEFKADNTLESISFEEFNGECSEFTFSTNWSLSGNIITVEDEAATITNLTSSTLTLELVFEEDGTTFTDTETYAKI